VRASGEVVDDRGERDLLVAVPAEPVDVVVGGPQRDAAAGASVHRVQLAAVHQLVEGGPADAEQFGGLADGQEERQHRLASFHAGGVGLEPAGRVASRQGVGRRLGFRFHSGTSIAGVDHRVIPGAEHAGTVAVRRHQPGPLSRDTGPWSSGSTTVANLCW
jgi:hypothetical protein